MQGMINNLKPYGEKFAEDAGALGNKLVGHIGEFAKENAEKLITAGLTVTTAFATKKLGIDTSMLQSANELYDQDDEEDQTKSGGKKNC